MRRVSRSRAGARAGEPGRAGAQGDDSREKGPVNCGLRTRDCGLRLPVCRWSWCRLSACLCANATRRLNARQPAPLGAEGLVEKGSDLDTGACAAGKWEQAEQLLVKQIESVAAVPDAAQAAGRVFLADRAAAERGDRHQESRGAWRRSTARPLPAGDRLPRR